MLIIHFSRIQDYFLKEKGIFSLIGYLLASLENPFTPINDESERTHHQPCFSLLPESYVRKLNKLL